MIQKDIPKPVKCVTPVNSRPNSSRKSSSLRLLSARSRDSRSKLTPTEKPKLKISQDGEHQLTSNEILVRLFQIWQPQLTTSYRPHVDVVPTHPDIIRAYIDAMRVHKRHNRDRFKAVERVVETVNHLHQASHSHRRESRVSLANIKFNRQSGET